MLSINLWRDLKFIAIRGYEHGKASEKGGCKKESSGEESADEESGRARQSDGRKSGGATGGPTRELVVSN
jgi:hypothetical protein